MSNDYLELRKAASRTTKFAREQARGQAAVVTTPLLEKPFGTAPVRVERMRGGPNAFGPVETTTVDALAPLNFAAEELSTPAAAGGMLTRAPALAGRALNAVVENVPTYLDRFYERSPLGQAYVFGKEALGAVPDAAKQMLSPQAAANARVKGTGARRIKELQEADPSTSQANVKASAYMRAQQENRSTFDKTLSDISPLNQVETRMTTTSDKPLEVKKGLTSDFDIPEDIADDMMKTVFEAQEVTGRSKPTTVVVRNPRAGSSTLGEQSVGLSGKTSSMAARVLSNQKRVDDMKAIYKTDELTKDQYKEILELSHMFNTQNVPKIAVHLPKDMRKMNGYELFKGYLSYKNKSQRGLAGGKNQKPVFDAVEKAKTTKTPKMKVSPARVEETKDGVLKLKTSYVSEAQELGGVGHLVVVDTKNKDLYGLVHDGHDMFGITPPGGNFLLNVAPIQKIKIGQGKGVKSKKRKTVEGKTEEKAVKELGRRTGIERQPRESLLAYQRRAIGDYQAPVTAQDRATVSRNIADTAAVTGGAGMLTGNLMKDKEER
jgi:hypothetical protein